MKNVFSAMLCFFHFYFIVRSSDVFVAVVLEVCVACRQYSRFACFSYVYHHVIFISIVLSHCYEAMRLISATCDLSNFCVIVCYCQTDISGQKIWKKMLSFA